MANTQQLLTPTIEPADATNKTVSWTSSNNTIARVSPIGMVTGKGEGDCIITAATLDGNFTATSNIHVNPIIVPISSIFIDSLPIQTVDVGSSKILLCNYYPENATMDELNPNFIWETDNPSSATIIESGSDIYSTVKFINSGRALITVRTIDRSKSSTVLFNINSNPTIYVKGIEVRKSIDDSIVLNNGIIDATVDTPITLKVRITPSIANNVRIKWFSDSAENLVIVGSFIQNECTFNIPASVSGPLSGHIEVKNTSGLNTTLTSSFGFTLV